MSAQPLPVVIGGVSVEAGQRLTVNLPVADLYTRTPVSLPVTVVRGVQAGPTLFVSAAMHGDEIIGVEIIRRVLQQITPDTLCGTVLAVPVVNVLAFLHQSRYLPDRRDLNRSFPGSEKGSLAARLAHRFVSEVVNKSDYGIDLHTGAVHRPNFPHIRADLSNAENVRLAKAFGAPLFLDSRPTEGTLRALTTARGMPVLLFEASEALRFDEHCIAVGVQGVINVMTEVGMLPPMARPTTYAPVFAKADTWVRAPVSGILRSGVTLGATVRTGDVLGVIGDPFGESETPVQASATGVIIGRANNPLTYEGEAVFHIAKVALAKAGPALTRFKQLWRHPAEPLLDD